MLDTIARPLTVVIAELTKQNKNYLVDYTYPPRRTFRLLEDNMYVIRQYVAEDETIHLVVSPKMGKEM